jgi:hypothetical protein
LADTAGARPASAVCAAPPGPRSIAAIGMTRLIGGYRRFIGSQDVPSCRFAPSCSEFTQEAIQQGGIFQGVLLGADRFTRCHPLSLPQAPAAGAAQRADGILQDPVAWYLQPPAFRAAPGSAHGPRVTAALLSAVLPGTGKAYCGRGADGLQSLLIVGTATWLACRGFERDGRRSIEGWGALGVGTIFYAGGILGAAASADSRGWRASRGRPHLPDSGAGNEPGGAPNPDPGAAGIPAGDEAGRGRAPRGISPAAAVLCSSIVPGSGQMLAGSFGRGLNALLLNAGLGAGVAVLARDRRTVDAGLLFSLGFLRYYHGNLYWARRLATERPGR